MKDYISPSQLMLFEKDLDSYYLKYLVSDVARDPQTSAMAVGSAFDAYVKAFLAERLYSVGDPRRDEFELGRLLEIQCEDAVRDRAVVDGLIVFEEYKRSGALSDLMLEIKAGDGEPRMETELRGRVKGVDIDLLGKPDLYWYTKSGKLVVKDWKVNGFYSKASPRSGYVRIRGSGSTRGLAKNIGMVDGITYNLSGLEVSGLPVWAVQLCIYAWLIQVKDGVVGDDFFVGIEQLVWSGGKMRTACHCGRIGVAWQEELRGRLANMYRMLSTGDGLPSYADRLDSAVSTNQVKASDREWMLKIPISRGY